MYHIAFLSAANLHFLTGVFLHFLIGADKYYYEGTTGGKLGWTPEARHTLVTLAEREGLKLICVVMRSGSQYDKYEDAAALLEPASPDIRPASCRSGSMSRSRSQSTTGKPGWAR